MPRRKNKHSHTISYPPRSITHVDFDFRGRSPAMDNAADDGPTYSDDSFERVMSPEESVTSVREEACLYESSEPFQPSSRVDSPLSNRSSKPPSPCRSVRGPTPIRYLHAVNPFFPTIYDQSSAKSFDIPPYYSRSGSQLSLHEEHENLVPQMNHMCLSARSNSPEELAELPSDNSRPVSLPPESPFPSHPSKEQVVDDQMLHQSYNSTELIKLDPLQKSLEYSTTSTPAPEFEKHDRYWFSDGSIIIKVESTLYNLHRSMLQQHSDWLLQKFLEPGFNQEMIDLENIKCMDFNYFLSFLYPYNYLDTKHSVDEWKSILTVATQLQFRSIRELAIQELATTANVIDRIILGRSLDIDQWLLPAFIELSEHPDPLTIEEGMTLGMETVIRVAAARERYLRRDTFLLFKFTQEMFGL